MPESLSLFERKGTTYYGTKEIPGNILLTIDDILEVFYNSRNSRYNAARILSTQELGPRVFGCSTIDGKMCIEVKGRHVNDKKRNTAHYAWKVKISGTQEDEIKKIALQLEKRIMKRNVEEDKRIRLEGIPQLEEYGD